MKAKMMILLSAAAALGGNLAYARKECTDQPRSKWMTEEQFKKKAEEEGYKIRKFKQPGSCYEIYGTDKDGKDVEIYFNPVDGSIAKRK
jgi:hypothetical protein